MEDKITKKKAGLENDPIDKADIKLDDFKFNKLSSTIRKINDVHINLSSAVSESMKPLINVNQKIGKLAIKLNEPLIDAPYLQKLKEIQEHQSELISKIRSPLLHIFESIDLNPLKEILKNLHDLSVDSGKIKEVYMSRLLEENWFPYIGLIAEPVLFFQIMEVIKHSKKSKNRTKKIDKLIFEYYTDKKIEQIKKSWRNIEVPEHIMRMLHQSVQAYHRREYAITVAMLATLWEGMIYNKVNDTRRKNGKRTKENFALLIDEDDKKVFTEYFNNLIMRDCCSADQIIEDVPGRNGVAHGYYKKYPTRKSALNAIMFTDCLLNLDDMKG